MENDCVVERTNSREGDQANYFYVVWPEETVTTLSATPATMDPNSLCNHRSATALHPNSLCNHRSATALHRQQQHSLQNHERRDRLMQQEHHELIENPSVAALSPTGGGRLSEIEVGSFASPLTSPILSIADASSLVTHNSAEVHYINSPKDVAINEKLPETINERNSFGEIHSF